MQDPRQARVLRARTLSALVIDSNGFTRTLIGDILRSLDVGFVGSARTEDEANTYLLTQTVDLIVISWEEGDALDGLGFCRRLRRRTNDRLRRLPVLFVTSNLTRQLVIDGRDAGVDEFLGKPISPTATRQRLEMVVETPRPFVTSPVYIGPCRRRKNPADYHGELRRSGDHEDASAKPLIDADEVEAQTPIRRALSALRVACRDLNAGSLRTALACSAEASAIAAAAGDTALQSAISTFNSYITVAAPLRRVEDNVLSTALGALEQLAALPLTYTDARESVASALSKAIQKKLAA
jgi:CheY-like chemotaxis protein